MTQFVPMYDSYAPNTSTTRYVPTGRMNVSAGVYLPNADVDIKTGELKNDDRRRCRTQGKRLEYERLDQEEKRLRSAVTREVSKGGIRISVRCGVLIIALLLFFCGIYLLMQQSVIVDRQKAINRLERTIAECKNANGALSAQIEEASDAATICYAASRNLKMIPAESAEAIHLVAMDTRPNQTVPSDDSRQMAEADVSARQPAGQTENTPVSMAASVGH